MFNKPIGPVEIWAGDTTAAAAKLFDVKESVNLKYEEEYAKSTMAKTGTSGRSKVVVGESCLVTGAAGEATIAQIAAIAGQAADSGNTRLALLSRVGKDLRDSAKVFILKPIIGGVVTTDAAKWYVIPAGTIAPKFDLERSPAGQEQYGFEIEGHPLTAEEVASGGRLAGEGFVERTVLVLGD
jgi:hypothetical protein